MKLLTVLSLGVITVSSVCTAASQTLFIDAASSAPVSTGLNLLAGHDYRLRVEGTFVYNYWLSDGTTFIADAEWSWDQFVQDGSWIETWPDPNGSEHFMDLLINGQGLDWRGTPDLIPGPNSLFSAHTFSPSHVYEADIAGQDAPLSFVVYDDPYWYDNAGSLVLTISEVPEPASLPLGALGMLTVAAFRRRKLCA